MSTHAAVQKRQHEESAPQHAGQGKASQATGVGLPLFMQANPTASAGITLQRKCACGSSSGANDECATCNRGKPLQAKLSIGASDDPLEQEADRVADQVLAMPANSTVSAAPPLTQRYAGQASEGTGTAPASVDRVLASSGRPMEPALRQDMEQRFGHDFSGVRVHSGEAAEQSAREVNANAYTVGHNIVFGVGRFAPETHEGRRLIAHELTHVIQQSGSDGINVGQGDKISVQRSACGHDGQKTGCRADLGVLKLRDESGTLGQMISIDRWVADDGLRHHFGGQWAAQVQTPPNPVKQGEDRGSADAVRVNDAGVLALDIVEIKARSVAGGGCALATAEARGYANVLTLIKPQVLALSAGLAKQGGVRVPSGKCRDPKAAERSKLKAAGVDFDNETSMHAWCFINSLQDRLNKTYTQAFSDVKVGLFADGDVKKTYPVWPPLRIDCPKLKGKKRPGWSFLGFQVNNKGGVSYGCRDECFDSEEEEKRRTQELVKEDEVRKRKQTAPRQTVPSGMYVDNPEQGDIGEDEAPVNLPEGGVSVTDVIAISGSALITVAILHQAAKVLKGRELEAARAAAARALAEARAKGAIDVARKMNKEHLTKQFGTKAYDKTVSSVATSVEKQALKDAGFIAKHGTKGAKFLGRAAGILGVLMLAKDAAAAVSHISKGGTIDIGLQGMDASLEGKTDIETSGPTGKQDVLGDVKLKDTQIDIETQGFPSVSGTVNLQAEKLTVRGRVGDGDAKINFTAKYKNTTITIRRDGQIKGGKLTMQGGSEISDADIEIDLPPGADLSKPRDPATPIVIKGGKIKITEVGSGGGSAGTAGKAGTPGGSSGAPPDVTPKADDKPAGDSGSVQIPNSHGQGSAPGQADGTGKAAAVSDIVELVQQVQASDGLRTLYAALLGKEDGVPVTAEMLRRLVDLKTTFDRHPGVVQEIIAGMKSAEITDPIKQIIEPIEERMRQAEQKLAKAREKAIADALTKASPSAKPAATTPVPVQKPAEKQEKPVKGEKASGDEGTRKEAGGGPGIDLASVRELSLHDLLPVLERSPQASPDKTPPKAMDYVLVWRVALDKSELVYYINAHMTLHKVLQPLKGEIWRASYKFTPPTGVILNSQGDMPIRFTDAGVITAEIVTTPPSSARAKP